ncbi:MAG: dienelactone hydrolase, partial [Microcystaceae cyanobacterium]
LECGPNTLVREAPGVKFSVPFFVTGTHFLIPKSQSLSINPNQSLKDVKIGVLRKTTTEAFIQEEYPDSKLVYFDGVAGFDEALQALANQQIDAFANDGILLLTGVMQKGFSPDDYQLVPKVPLTCDYYGLILPQNDAEWQELINGFLSSQSAKKIGEKTFTKEIEDYLLFQLDYCLNLKYER